MKLSNLMPVYNEASTIDSAVQRVLAVDYPRGVELVLVDDGSTDGTTDPLPRLDDLRIVGQRHAKNRGKGVAIRTANELATGDHMIIRDADLEYSVRSAGLCMQAEVTAKLPRSGSRPYEVPISYPAPSREDGKRLTWRVGVEALWILLRPRTLRGRG